MEYEYTVNKVISMGSLDYNTDQEARLEAARIKNIYQAQDPDNEYWFDYKVAGSEPDVFMLQVVTDGAVTWSKKYDCPLQAVRAYDKVIDHGFARYEREAVLIEPNGKVHTKLFLSPYGKARV
jgi:hypothetical protein